jgi:geranylgeranyl diphosphate synthase type II
LVAAALKMGAIVAETNHQNANLIYDFGLNLGLAFQLQDDYLDTFGNPETFGKQIGGDIIENKKTYLYLKALEVASEDDQQKLAYFYRKKLKDNSIKITEVTRIFELNDIPILIKEQIEDYTEKAFSTLLKMDISKANKQNLKNFGLWLMNRTV